MIYDFVYENHTKICFGKNSLSYLEDELKKYGDNILLAYGGGSIKKIGLYDEIIAALKKQNKNVYELSNILPNPTYDKVLEGIELVNKHKIDFILAVGGGSVIDASKAISASYLVDNPWEYYWVNHSPVLNNNIPVGAVLTISGTGSEMNSGSVITKEDEKFKKGHVFEPFVAPKFAILNPEVTYSISIRQLKSTSFDIMSHLMEQYFSGHDDNVSDYLLEALMKATIVNLKKALINPKDYEARSNLVWASTMALNKITGLSKRQDWNVHCLEHQLGAYTNCPHGLGLAVISRSYYYHLLKYAPDKFRRFAINVFDVDETNKTDLQIAKEGIDKLINLLDELNYPKTLRELNTTEDMLIKIANTSEADGDDYHKFNSEEYLEVLKEVY